MSIKIELSDQKRQHILSIRKTIVLEKLPSTIAESYKRIMTYLSRIGEQPSDAPFTAYYTLDMHKLDVEMGFPVAKKILGNGEIVSGEIPEGKIVTMMYKGPYKDMEQPYNEMFKWIEENGYEQTGVYYEYYYNSPREVPESELLTKIVIPVK